MAITIADKETGRKEKEVNKIKKYLGFVMAALMVFALTPMSAFAAEGDGSITIKNALKGSEFDAYQILVLESYDADTNHYAYKPASELWATFLGQHSDVVKTVAAEPVAVSSVDDYVQWVGDLENPAIAAQFAKDALAWAKENNISASGSGEANAEGVAVIGSLPLGYYVVDSTLGTICHMDTTNPNADITEKNDLPTNDKQVKEDSTNQWGSSNDATIGQLVEFQSVIDAKAGAKSYVFHDKMSEGLTFSGVNSIVVTVTAEGVADRTIEAGSDDAANFTVNASPTDGCTFEIAFTQSFCDTLTDADSIVISYSAVLNEKAVIAGEGNSNQSKLVYGDNGEGDTGWDTTHTYTWSFNVFKHNTDGAALAGATFTLTDADNNPVKFTLASGTTYRVDPKGEIDAITTTESGRFTIQGLDAGVYKLTEDEAPAGYNKIDGFIEVVIGENGAVSNVVMVDDIAAIDVLNQSGVLLPSTGGIGTTLFYIGGAVLIIGAVVFLVTRRRANSAK